MPLHAINAQKLRNCRVVILNGIDEKVPAERCEFVEPLRARLQQLEHSKKPRAPFAEEFVLPNSARLEPSPEARRTLRRRKPNQILLVEPVQRVRSEDRVAAADARQVENVRELVEREQLAIAAAR